MPGRLPFFLSRPHPCQYLPGRRAQVIFADPQFSMSPETYSGLCRMGFRRSGDMVYRPACPGCDACVPVRVPAAGFRPDRSQSRCWRGNADLEVFLAAARYDAVDDDLLRRYLAARHPGGDMARLDSGRLRSFLVGSWSDTRFLRFHLAGRLVAVMVLDRLRDGWSAVYSYFEPDLPRRGLGVYGVLRSLEMMRGRQREYLYLGYFIAACRKMAYKAVFRPQERFLAGRWQEFAG